MPAVILISGQALAGLPGGCDLLAFSRLAMLIILQCICLNWISPAYAVRLKCADFPVAYEFEGPEEIQCVCETARAALSFLKTLGLETTEVIALRLAEHLPPHQLHNLVGSYNPKSREVTLLTYSKALALAQQNKSILDIALSEEVWCSYAAHELAHAVSNQHINSATNNHLAGEYIAVVTQLAVLTTESRDKILKKFQNVEAYKSRSEMSVYYYLFAPKNFAVKCYLHFISLDDPKEFVKRLVNEENGGWDGY